jgi:hypothetical protein
MKRTVLFLTLALFLVVSCSKEDDPQPATSETNTMNIDASSDSTWHYFSFSEQQFIGSGTEDPATNAEWFARDDWDIAVMRYFVRTNSGDATTIGSQGGVYTCEESIEFATLEEVPSGATFETDQTVTKSSHGNTYDIVLSTAQVIQFQQNPDGSLVMPPVYLQSPVYIFKSADGEETHKVNCTQYINAYGDSGHVVFESAQLF